MSLCDNVIGDVTQVGTLLLSIIAKPSRRLPLHVITVSARQSSISHLDPDSQHGSDHARGNSLPRRILNERWISLFRLSPGQIAGPLQLWFEIHLWHQIPPMSVDGGGSGARKEMMLISSKLNLLPFLHRHDASSGPRGKHVTTV